MTRFSNDSLQFHGVLNGSGMSAAVTLRCIGQLTHSENLTVIGPDTGAAYRETRFVGERKPEITGTVMALEQILATLSLLGTNCMTADGSHPGVRAFMQSHSPCAANARTAGSNHRRLTFAKSHVLVTQIGGARGQSASANIRIIGLSTDGEADPEAFVNNADLPSTFVDDEEFVIGAPMVNGITIAADHVISWSLDTGIGITVITAAGSIYPTAVDITKVAPVIRIQHDDPTLLDASGGLPADGIECAHADTELTLIRRTPFGGLYPLDEPEHIKLTAAGYAYHSRAYDASGSAVGTGEITIECTEGVGGVPLTAAVNQALA